MDESSFGNMGHKSVAPDAFAWGHESNVLWDAVHLILWVLLAGFASVAWSMALESMVLSQLDLAWSSKFLQPKQNFI